MASSVASDWQLHKSVLDSNKYMLDNQLYCDVTFVFGEESEKTKNFISAHKYMLISRSPVFCAMFTGPVKEESSEIKIKDVDKDSYTEMLRYIYYEEASLTGQNVLAILYCAKKYNISGLEKLCTEFLEDQMDHNNVCFILEQASSFGETALQEKCLSMIDKYAQKAFESEGFIQLARNSLQMVMRRDTLEVEELDVFKACIRWAEAECERLHLEVTDQNKRKVLGDLIYLIRFPNMDADEFILSVSSTEVLTMEESLNLILLMKGSTPKKELAVSSVERRGGTWTEEFFKGLSIVPQHGFVQVQANQAGHFNFNSDPTLLNASVPFQINCGKNKMICIKSVFLINNTNYEFSGVRLLESEGKISKLENRTYVGCQLHEAVFNPIVRMQSNKTASILVQLKSNTTASVSVQQFFVVQQPAPRQYTLVQGQCTIGANPSSHTFFGKAQAGGFPSHTNPSTNTTITMQNVPWNFAVGFKFKTVEKV